MAAIPISISGMLYDKTARTQQPVYIIGSASIVGLTVGGGPIIPPEDIAPPDSGPPGSPTFPISGPPGIDFPDKPGYPPVVGGGPIIPDPPPVDPPQPEPPPISVAVKPPPETGGWGWIAPYGWGYFPPPGAAGPKT